MPHHKIKEPSAKHPRYTEPPKTQDNQSGFLLYLCCFLDEISLPVAFFIPIIGQLYLGARIANDFETLTNEKYSFFGCSSNQAKNESEPCQLNWNFAPI